MPWWDHKQNCKCLKQGPHNSSEYLHILATLLRVNPKAKNVLINFFHEISQAIDFSDHSVTCIGLFGRGLCKGCTWNIGCVCVNVYMCIRVQAWHYLERICLHCSARFQNKVLIQTQKCIPLKLANCGLKESKAKAGLLSSFSSSVAIVIQLRQLLTRLGLKFTSTMR